MNKTVIYSDNIHQYPELAAAAQSLGKEAVAYVIGSQADADEVAPYVSEVYFSEQGDKMVEDYFKTFATLISEQNAGLVLIGASKRGRYMSGRLAASNATSVLTDLSSIQASNEDISGTQMYYGGIAINTLKSNGNIAIATLPFGSHEPIEKKQGTKIVPVSYVADIAGITRKEVRGKEGTTVNLVAAKYVVGVGRGFAKKEDLQLAEQLAKAIGGEVGCSRPISEGEGWMETNRYIGVSGVMLKPDVYFAIGISGQVQHTIGIDASKTIIAINKDKNAPIFKNCDYGIVGDLMKVLPELTQLIQA